jgi:hypothetical protein
MVIMGDSPIRVFERFIVQGFCVRFLLNLWMICR